MNTIDPIKPGVSEALSRLWPRTAEAIAVTDMVERSRQRIEDRMIREVEAMVLFAMSAGIGLSQELVGMLERGLPGDPKGADRPGALSRQPADGTERPTPSQEQPSAGTAIEPAGGESVTAPELLDQMSLLAMAHLTLARLVAPAKPGTLVLLIEQRRNHPYWHSFGAVPMVRRMLALAVLSLVLMLGIALSSEVNAENMPRGLLNLQGTKLLVNEIFLLAASGVGATLANLKQLDRYISNCTYDRRYDSSYWTRLVMGLISGVILSQVIFGALAGTGSVTASADTNDVLGSIGQPVLALLGGFSAELVHDILTQFITVVGQLFGGKGPPANNSDAADPARAERQAG
jgi:hypothetical protein